MDSGESRTSEGSPDQQADETGQGLFDILAKHPVLGVIAVVVGIVVGFFTVAGPFYEIGRDRHDDELEQLQAEKADWIDEREELKSDIADLKTRIDELVPPPPTPTVNITEPAEQARVSSVFRIRGTSTNIDTAHEMWIVSLEGDDLYYPQHEKPIDRLENGEWLSPEIYADRGDGDPVGEQFTYMAVVVKSDATASLFSEKRSTYSGLSDLPPDVTRYAQVVVTVDRVIEG